MSKTDSDLEVFAPAPSRRIDLGGGAVITARTLRVRELATIARLVAPLRKQLAAGEPLLQLALHDTDTFIELGRIMLDLPQATFEELTIAQVQHGIESVLEANSDFFVQAILPMVPRLLENTQRKVAGSLVSMGLSAPATDSTKSSS